MTKTLKRHAAGEPFPSADWNDAAASIEQLYPNAAGELLMGVGPSSAPARVALPVFNVKHPPYNATGDGTTDDTAAFQSAINDAVAAHGTLLIPPATNYYKIASTLIIQPASGSMAFLNIDAHTPPSGIQWAGGSNASMFSVRGLKYGRIRGLKILVGAQDDVRVFDVLQTGTALSSGLLVWENIAINLGSGKACNGWRWGAAAAGGESSFNLFHNCVVTQATGTNTNGHVGWRNLDGNHLVSQWTNCAGSFLTHMYSGATLVDRLNGAIDASVTTIPINSTVGWAPTGSFIIDSEKVTYTGISGNSFTGCTRGALSTTAATHVDNTFANQGIQDPVGLTWRYSAVGGAGHTFTGCGGSFNWREFLTLRGTLTINGGRWEGVNRLLQVGWQGSTSVEATFTGVTVNVGTLPADGIIVAIGHVGVYTFTQCEFYGVDFTSAMVTAGAYDDMGGPTGTLGSINLTNCSIRSAGTSFITQPGGWKAPNTTGSLQMNSAGQPQAFADRAWGPKVSADVGDAAKTLTAGVDEPTQRWNTPLTLVRAVTLSTTGAKNGDAFHIVREATATGAFNLNVGTGPLKALATASTWCDVEFDGTAWRLTANGAL